MRFLIAFTGLLLWLTVGCTKSSEPEKTEFWIYTSLYKDVIKQMEVSLQKRFPNVNFKWYQSGSENVAARMGAELTSGKSMADLVMTADPFWYLELKNEGHLLKYESPATKRLSAGFRDKDNAFTIVRIPTLVMAYNPQAIKTSEAPKNWTDLTNNRWKGLVSMGSPLQSGTAFCAVSQLVRKYSWDYFGKLRKNEILSAGGNSAVISRLETKERPVGIVLLENILDAQRRGSPIKAIYPTEGAILAPSPIAIMAKTKHPELAKEIYDFFFSNEMQMANLAGRMYSPFPEMPAPRGALAFKELYAKAFEWGPTVLKDIYLQRESIKKQFVGTVLN